MLAPGPNWLLIDWLVGQVPGGYVMPLAPPSPPAPPLPTPLSPPALGVGPGSGSAVPEARLPSQACSAGMHAEPGGGTPLQGSNTVPAEPASAVRAAGAVASRRLSRARDCSARNLRAFGRRRAGFATARRQRQAGATEKQEEVTRAHALLQSRMRSGAVNVPDPYSCNTCESRETVCGKTRRSTATAGRFSVALG